MQLELWLKQHGPFPAASGPSEADGRTGPEVRKRSSLKGMTVTEFGPQGVVRRGGRWVRKRSMSLN